MGFGDREVENSFDSLFDMNWDGILDPVEQGFQLDFIQVIPVCVLDTRLFKLTNEDVRTDVSYGLKLPHS